MNQLIKFKIKNMKFKYLKNNNIFDFIKSFLYINEKNIGKIIELLIIFFKYLVEVKYFHHHK